eukprot:TRINITY_DN13765_c0_g1_i1.p2 TRINITY_DN13765_c0_g1~~TRINITY_DN13765_c0_g1_i1.p2  ORF type:complete len:113 (-),score=7.85 TRINITY_DN13765_c0_g1_i1:201-539(-)
MRDIRDLKRPSLKIKERKTFITYTEQCTHQQVKCNTVPIFECCNQSYQCPKCHDKYNVHKAKLINPSKRYCMKCYTVFQVDYDQTIPINCNSCLEKDIQAKIAEQGIQNINQ